MMNKLYITILCFFVSILCTNAQCTDNGNYWNESWVSCTTSPNPNAVRGNSHWILYEFHENQYIDSSYVWNANRTGESGWGAKDVVIDYSADGTTWIELGTFTFPQGDESTTYAGFLGPRFNGVFLQKILITVLNTHDGGTCASLAEMQFKIDQTACYGTIDVCGICNGPGEMIWYIDADGDGLGSVDNTVNACTQPTGYVANNTDACDNGNIGWTEVDALFSNNGCSNNCHGAGASGGLDLRTYASTISGGNTCGNTILSGTRLVDIITISGYNACGVPISIPSMNDRAGNQLDAMELAMLQKWIDGGAPEFCTDFCENNKTITATYPTGTTVSQEVSNQITANNIIVSGANITYDAGTQICLDPGFEVQQGAEFLGMIDGCTSVNIQETMSSEK